MNTDETPDQSLKSVASSAFICGLILHELRTLRECGSHNLIASELADRP